MAANLEMAKPKSFARLLKLIERLRGKLPSPRPVRAARLGMETLEDRCCMSVLAGVPAPAPVHPDQSAWLAEHPAVILDSVPTTALWNLGLSSFGESVALDAAFETEALGDATAAMDRTDAVAIVAIQPLGRPDALPVGTFAGLTGGSSDQRKDHGGLKPRDGRDPHPGIASPLAQQPRANEPASPAPESTIEQGRPPLRLLSRHEPVVTSSVASAAGVSPDNSPAGQAGVFRISRTPTSSAKLEVHYALAAFGRGGAVGDERAAVIRPGSAHVDILPGLGVLGKTNGHEIVTLLLRDNGAYQIGKPAATLFLAGSSRGCSEAALFEAYRWGQSKEAFNALVELHRPTVFRTCYGILGNWLDAEDVSQIVFLVLAQRNVQLQTTLSGWLRRVARNASLGFLRSKRRRAHHERRAAKAVLALDQSADHALREELDAALTQLPAPLREAVRLRYLDGLSQREAAQRLGCPRGTLSQRAARGIRWLRDILGGANQVS